MTKKHQAFHRVAGRRTCKAIEAIRRLHNCANRQTYDYTPEEAAKIIRALKNEVDVLEAKFFPPEPERKDGPVFSFGGGTLPRDE